mmetsp:Transcript_702/g.2064  ORF Transcript_702/g.2064 Transcript_702/m.2064 type:complete len:293 (+) Transcript_702:119-997(+)
MKTILETRVSPGCHLVCAGPKSICSWTPWNTNFWSPWPANDSTPLDRYKSAARVWSNSAMKMLNLGTSRKPSTEMPTDATIERSWTFFSPSCLSKRTGSMSTQRSMSNDEMPMIFERSTRDRSHSMTSAKLLMAAMRARIAAFSSGDTRSTLLRRILSENATCCTASFTAPSGFSSSRCALTCFAEARQTTASMRKLSSIHWFDLSVAMMGAGSASPVVSSMMASNCARFSTSDPSVRTRSPRMEQHAQPLSIWIRSSFEAMFSETSFSSMLISPNSFSMTQMRLSRCSVRM